jgi:hypothetical protein
MNLSVSEEEFTMSLKPANRKVSRKTLTEVWKRLTTTRRPDAGNGVGWNKRALSNTTDVVQTLPTYNAGKRIETPRGFARC